jgi:hypothetical protein
VSGLPRFGEVARGIQADATFPKPFDAEELIRMIRILTGGGREAPTG